MLRVNAQAIGSQRLVDRFNIEEGIRRYQESRKAEKAKVEDDGVVVMEEVMAEVMAEVVDLTREN